MDAGLHDFIIIGGGIVGASTAWQLKRRYSGCSCLLLEKEQECAMHQTGRNSGVIHAGVYYQPGSLKADFCRRGAADTMAFCRAHGLPFEQCGKLVVATDERESRELQVLYRRCVENRIDCSLLDPGQLRQLEPAISGRDAILVRATGITDFSRICRRLVECLVEAGGAFQGGTEVLDLGENDSHVTVTTSCGILRCRYLVVCAGLMADRLATRHGLRIGFRIIPFRGEYYRLAPCRDHLVRHLIYPVPDPSLPFLGVHLTRLLDGGITIGPNAVPGWKREGYGRVNFHSRDALDILGYGGFWRLLARYRRATLGELMHSLSRRGYLARVRKYCPQLRCSDLTPHPAGVRAQAVMRDGSLVHDFLFAETPRSLHVCNAPSPAATAALPIGAYLCAQVGARLPAP